MGKDEDIRVGRDEDIRVGRDKDIRVGRHEENGMRREGVIRVREHQNDT